MSITKAIFSLPVYVAVPNGPEFQLLLSHNGPNITLAYGFLSPVEKNYWENPYLTPGKKRLCNFLYLAEWMETDADLLKAIEDTKAFLNKNGLML